LSAVLKVKICNDSHPSELASLIKGDLLIKVRQISIFDYFLE